MSTPWVARGLWTWTFLALAGCGPRIDLSRDAGPVFRPPVDGGTQSLDGGVDGGLDAGGARPDAGLDAGPPDAAVVGIRLEGEVCTVDDPCAAGLSCLQDIADPLQRICRRDCYVLDGNLVVEVPEVCDEFESCQTVLDPTTTQWVATACAPIQYVRDGVCFAFEDPDACALGRACAASEVTAGPDGVAVVEAMRCRDTCTFGDADDDSCTFDDVCLFDWITTSVVDYQLVNDLDPDSRVTCPPALCEDPSAPGCPCHDEDGYRCVPVQNQNYCVHTRGLCGVAAPYVGLDDLPLNTGQLCNEVVDHDFCDREPYRDLDNGALPLCLDIQGPRPDDGICIAFCSQYAFDYNGDGSTDLAGGEGPLSRACLDGDFCDRAFSREIGLYNPGPVEVACDPLVCPEGEPCGPCNGVECVTSDFFVTTPSACAAVFGTCQPLPPPDAGVDAGDPLVDGGLDGGAGDGGLLDAGQDGGAGDAA